MPDLRPKSRRRLAAILAADVVGSCRLMEVDEEAAASAIRAILSGIIEPAAARHRGRLVKTMGDGALLEFASPVEAVLCAVEAQTAIADPAGHDPGNETIRLRMGINLGDVLVGEDEDILGDGVNIAVRLEGTADPGGICISGKVFDELEGKLSLPFEDRGEQRLKNIARPVHVYALRGGNISAHEPKAARPGPDHTDKPSIAVLPFTNLSGDSEREYFADGITDDVITALAKTRWLFVTARNSSFAFKSKALETEQVARRLGVRYVLSGSVRCSGSCVRVSAQLTEAETGGSIWAERYDREVGDILALQDQIAEEVAGAIEPELLKKEGQRGAERPQSMTVWDLVRRGMWEFHKIRPESHRRARELFLKAIEAEPDSADGYLWLARVEAGLAAYGWSGDPDASLRHGMMVSLQAVQLDERNPYSHYAVAVTHVFGGEVETALQAAQRAVALSPSFALGYLVLGVAHLYAGGPKEAIAPLEHGLRLSPFDPQNFSWLFFLALAYFFAGEPRQALGTARRALSLRPDWHPALKLVVICCAALGDRQQARSAASALRASDPGGDLIQSITRFNPVWAEEIDGAVRQALEEPPWP
ncbi:adenylate/guanylate cyclase domain-containing protein [Microvirga brassicacearum]|uniref:Adenylate/guanylate cyclase domain-containing protein n=1 Tax=Microvirga brassicacearum TaxID=2580413 RepID=A0A5N3PHQ0_9HYPH|nr:adenylate/guanylate cyclase domain-containing protein [Microvirga brassicacearum]KAB0269250.1 adenylate/guanylate cyclase domain-containing protein [Microvirga brassicacearum]